MPAVTFTLMGINTAIHLVMMILFFSAESAHDRAYQLFGLTPAVSAWHTYLTHCFMHADIFHLIGNMIYLFLFGACVEDIVGRGKFLTMYLISGVLAGAAHVAISRGSEIPLVGASGAISACMGAFVLLLHNRQIEFKYFFIFFFRVFAGDFFLPAWLVMSFWFGMDLLGLAIDLSGSDADGGGVAYGAHIGGFLVGMAAVPGLKKLLQQEESRERAQAIARKTEVTWTAAIPPDAQITVQDHGLQYGPYTLAGLWGAHREGLFSEDALYWHDGMEDWALLSEAL